MPDDHLTPDELRARGLTEEEIGKVARIAEEGIRFPARQKLQLVPPPDPLIAFLRARLDEREAKARAFPEEHRRWRDAGYVDDRGGRLEALDIGRTVVFAGPGDDGPLQAVEVQHIADNDPAFVLDDVAAKRRIIDLVLDEDNGVISADRSIESEWGCTSDLHEQLLKLLALPYAGHPEFREEWRP